MIRSMRALRGPNVYAYMPVIHVVLEVGPYEVCGSDNFPGFVERLTAWLPGLSEHKCSVGKPGGFIERLHRGTYLGHIAEHVVLELQDLIGFPRAFGRTRGTGEPGVYDVVFAYREEEPARAAFDVALRLTLAAMHDEPIDAEGEIERLMSIADEYRLGPSTQAIVDAARARHIPTMRLTPRTSLVQLGYGVHQKRIRAAETSSTSSIAVDICQDKPLTNRMLRMVGVPSPEGRVVGSADEAWQAAQDVGVPVVVKPANGNQGKGVSVGLSDEPAVKAAYEGARQFSGEVMVERFIEGQDYRMLVVGGRLVAAARRDPPAVVGDGEQSVRALIEALNQDPRRRPGHASALSRVQVNAEVELTLQQAGLTLDSVPEADRRVLLRTNSNLSTGGTAVDVTEKVHPENVQVAELAAQILALDIAGVDVVVRDIGEPIEAQGGAIVEVNAAPGLRMHIYPAQGQSRDVGRPIVETLYPDGAPSRIPILAITGTNGKTTVTRLIAHMYRTAHKKVGMTCTDGTYLGENRILKGDSAGPKSARAVLLHPRVEVAVLETARGGILREGLAFDTCKVAVVTNIAADHLGLRGVETLKDLARVKEVLVEAVMEDGAAVLNAEDPLVAEMAASCYGEVVYFSSEPDHPVIRAHLESDGRAVLLEAGAIVLATGADRVPLIELERVPFLLDGQVQFQVMNALAATAAAWAEGLNPAFITRALTTFTTDTSNVPGRFNVLETDHAQVIVDYGHNAAALQALAEAAEALGPRHTTIVFTLPGDRRDEDLVASVEALGSVAQHYVLYDSEDLRERAPGEVPALIRQALPEGISSELAVSRADAIPLGWQRVPPGGRLIVIADDDVEDTIEQVRNLLERDEDGDACNVFFVDRAGMVTKRETAYAG
ncbi:MAG TPA: cyanophycin synthetase [Anaerolineae bacterium]|nr:cyanophycin synthetase [Anaerolineae bacterium]